MIFKKVTRKLWERSSNNGLVRIKLADPYCINLESHFPERANPFRRLLIETQRNLKDPTMEC